MPVLTVVRAAPTSTACSMAVSAPSRRTSAHANGRSSGWPSIGSAAQDQLTTVPVSATSTKSVTRRAVTGSYSAGGTKTRPSLSPDADDPAVARPVMNGPSVGPSERV